MKIKLSILLDNRSRLNMKAGANWGWGEFTGEELWGRGNSNNRRWSPNYSSCNASTSTLCIFKTSPRLIALYDKLKTRRPYISFMSPLKCEKHPFSKGLSDTYDEINSFFHQFFPWNRTYSRIGLLIGAKCERRSLQGYPILHRS